MTDGHINVVLDWSTTVDHETVNKLHGLGPLSTQLARDHHLTALGATLHDEAQDSIAGPPDGKTSDQLVAEGLALGDGTETTGSNLLSIQL